MELIISSNFPNFLVNYQIYKLLVIQSIIHKKNQFKNLTLINYKFQHYVQLNLYRLEIDYVFHHDI